MRQIPLGVNLSCSNRLRVQVISQLYSTNILCSFYNTTLADSGGSRYCLSGTPSSVSTGCTNTNGQQRCICSSNGQVGLNILQSLIKREVQPIQFKITKQINNPSALKQWLSICSQLRNIRSTYRHRHKYSFRGCHSETGFHLVMERNFVCLWRRNNCN